MTLVLLSHLAVCQVVVRNDFIIHHNKRKLENRGITHVVFNVGSRNSWNLNAYGQPVASIDLDIAALQGKTDYSYREIVEKLYRPGAVFKRSYIPIPLFLLLEPPRKLTLERYRYLTVE